MNSLTTSAFDPSDRLAAKGGPALIAGDEEHFAAIAEGLERWIADLSDHLDAERKAPGSRTATVASSCCRSPVPFRRW